MLYIEIVGLDGAGKSRLSRSLVYHLGDRARLISVSMAEITLVSARRVVTSDAISPITRAMAYMAAHSEAYDLLVSDVDAGIDYLIGDRGEVLILDGSCPPNILGKRVLKELKRLSRS
ncbi:MAG: hypothetical protein OXH65_06340 [Paracoccaceae bacterium]|nr:hypothetical protein [Paracoccaceae bacterium]